MSTFFYLFRELLGAVRTKSALSFGLTGGLFFLFLASVGAFFVIGPSTESPAEDSASRPVEELRAYLSPRLSSASVDKLFLELREREDVAAIEYHFAQEVDPTMTGGVLFIRPVSPAASADLSTHLRSMNGMTGVVEIRTTEIETASVLPTSARIGLLLALLVTLGLSFFFARRGYRALLHSFASEIRLMRLSGISDRVIVPLLAGLGVLIGCLAGVFLLVVLYLLHYFVVAQATPPAAMEGLRSAGRVLGVSLGTLFLGVVLGGLIGLFGANVLASREFDPLP